MNFNIAKNTIPFKEINNKKYEKIYHISDLHIRPCSRIDEFETVFNRFIQFIKSKKNLSSSLVVITGDLLHSKNTFKPVSYGLLSSFLYELSKHIEVIIITGNHDMNEQNLEEIDSLTPICKLLPIHYLRKSGIYKFGNFVFVVSSLIDANFIKYKDLLKGDSGKYIKSLDDFKELVFIKLFHGAIAGASTDTGCIIKDEEVKGSSKKKTNRFRKISDFSGYDAVLLGDIHKHQFLKKNIAYSGSLIQQNFGETLENHGVLEWIFKDDKITNTFYEIENDFGYVKFHFVDNKLINKLKKYPKKIYAKIYLKNSDESVIEFTKKYLSNFDSALETCCIEYVSEEFINNIELDSDATKHIDDLKIIKDIITENKMNDKFYNDICKYHENVKKILSSDINDMNPQIWKINSMTFMNMFIYGSDNTNVVPMKKGVTVLSAPNNNGKSSLLKTLLFGLFASIDSAGSSLYVINHLKNKEKSFVKVDVNVGNKNFIIEKYNGSIRHKKVNGKNTPWGSFNNKFSLVTKEGIVDKTSTDSRETTKRICNKIGSKDIFMYLNVCSNKNSKNFVTEPDKKRLSTLQDLLKLNLYTLCYKHADTDIKNIIAEKNKLIGKLNFINDNRCNIDDINKQISNLAIAVSKKFNERKELTTDLKKFTLEKKDFENEINNLCKNVDSDCFKFNFDEISEKYNLLKDSCEGKDVMDLSELNKKKDKLFKKIINVSDNIEDDIEECNNDLSGLGWNNADYEFIYNSDDINSIYDNRTLELKDIKRQISSIQKSDKLLEAKYNIKDLQKNVKKFKKKIKTYSNDSNSDISELSNKELNSKLNGLYKLIHHFDEDSDNSKLLDIYTKSLKVFNEELSKFDMDGDEENCSVSIDDLKSKLAIINSKIDPLSNTDDSIKTDKSVGDINSKIESVVVGKFKKDFCWENVLISSTGKISMVYSKKPMTQNKDLEICRKVSIGKISENCSWIDNTVLIDEHKKLTEMLSVIELNEKINNIKEKIVKCENNIKVNEDIKQIELYIENIENISNVEKFTKIIDEIKHNKSIVKDLQSKYNTICEEIIVIEKEMNIYKLLNNIEKLKSDLKIFESNKKVLKKIDKINLDIDLSIKINEFNSLKDIHLKFINSSDYLKQIDDLKNESDNVISSINDINRSIKNIDAEMNIMTAQIDELKNKIEQDKNNVTIAKKIEDDINKFKYKNDLLVFYKNMVKTSGIPAKLISSKLKYIVDFVNNFIKDFTNIIVDMFVDLRGKDNAAFINISKNKKLIDVNNLGAFESWLISVAFKTALNRYSFYSKSSFLIIDEELDCIDNINFDTKLPNILKKLKTFYHTILIISHRDIQKFKDHSIYIKNDGVSTVVSSVV